MPIYTAELTPRQRQIAYRVAVAVLAVVSSVAAVFWSTAFSTANQ